jgi:hypothetical protein
MLFGVSFSVILFLTVSARDKIKAEKDALEGYYYMPIPGNGNQYVFNIDYSPTFNQYLVVVTGQSLAWATARLNLINDTAVNLVCDNGDTLTGIINYPTDLPSICWPAVKNFPCWNRLLSNITRIHVINM